MEIKIGTIVKSAAGRDKNSFYVIVGYDKNNMPLIADGRRRKLEKPKAKNPKHISRTNTTTEITALTNKKLRAVLHGFNFSGISVSDGAKESD